MSRIAGVATQKNTKGEITHLTIDVKKHRDIVAPLLEQLGVKTTSKFEEDWKRGITLDEARKNSHDFIRKLWNR